MQTLIETLRLAVGDAHVLTEGDLSAWEQDWRRRVHGKALAVVRPANTQEVAAVVKACAAAGAPIVPQGGNTGLSVGSTPDTSGREVVLSLTRMNAVRALDKDNLTLTVEAGCILQNVQDAAEKAGLLFPLSLAAEGSCTIGGNLGTNAGGTQVVRYGNTRDLCLGLEVVTPQGEVWDGLRGLRKDNTGYDLRDLFIGSEGTLGIITAATLKLFPRPAATLTALAACPDIDAAIGLLRRARMHLDAGLTGFEVMGAFALQLQARHFPLLRNPLPASPWTVLLELAAGDATEASQRLSSLMEEAEGLGLASDAVVAGNLAQAHALWELRESIPLAQAREGLNIKHDVALPVSAIPDFLRHMDTSLDALVPGVRMVVFGHLGDGNLHFNVQAPEGMPAAEFLHQHETALNQTVYDAVLARGGTFSAEHGIGALKVDELAKRKSPVALGMMRAIKQALDPQGLLNPGRVLPPP
jgi:FAD/FMN-containing dehydrogenase